MCKPFVCGGYTLFRLSQFESTTKREAEAHMCFLYSEHVKKKILQAPISTTSAIHCTTIITAPRQSSEILFFQRHRRLPVGFPCFQQKYFILVFSHNKDENSADFFISCAHFYPSSNHCWGTPKELLQHWTFICKHPNVHQDSTKHIPNTQHFKEGFHMLESALTCSLAKIYRGPLRSAGEEKTLCVFVLFFMPKFRCICIVLKTTFLRQLTLKE